MPTREYVTSLLDVKGQGGSHRIIAGTRTRLYSSTGDGGSWRLLKWDAASKPEADLPKQRWRTAQLGNIIVATNYSDYPQSFTFDQNAGPDGQTATDIEDCIALGLTQVKLVAEWKGFMFYANVILEGETMKNRIMWSDFNDPLSITPLPESAASYIDLPADEEILALAPIGGSFRVYTNRAIYDIRLIGGEDIFAAPEIYRGPMALAFENSLVNLGDSHVYATQADLVVMREFDRWPQDAPWLTAAAGAIYKGLRDDLIEGLEYTGISAFGPINRGYCHALCGGYDGDNKMIWMSWPTEEDTSGVPSVTLVIQPDQAKACLVDHGFTAFCVHQPAYATSFRRWAADMGVCEPLPTVAENDPLPIEYVEDTTLTSFRNAAEDADYPADATSICEKLADHPELEPSCSPCTPGAQFVMADAQDKTLKRYTHDIAERERCMITDALSSALGWTVTSHPFSAPEYVIDGYVTVIQGDARHHGTDLDKTIHRIAADLDVQNIDDPVGTDDRPYLHAHIGVGEQPHKMIWYPAIPLPIDHLSSTSNAGHKAAKTRPNKPFNFPFYRTGGRVAFRLAIASKELGPTTRGIAAFNGARVSMQGSQGENE